MSCLALACDYDGTIALDGTVDDRTVEVLRRFQNAGRKLLLVTGREFEELRSICPQLGLFDLIVAENGALLYNPRTGQTRSLAQPPPPRLVQLLRERGVHPLSLGHTILATREPYQTVVLEAIHALGLEYHIIFNKGAVMILPSAVNKATGLKAALKELHLRPQDIAGVGDAENDHAFLDLCGFSAAVANALPALKEHVDWVTPSDHGAGVVELVERLLNTEVVAPQLRT